MRIINEDFDLRKIAESGQTFRMNERENGVWDIYAADRYLRAKETSDGADLNCGEDEYHDFWENYFDMETDYKKIRQMIDKDDLFLKKSAEIGKGIRILRQDPYEMLITFIISQRKNIPAIKSCVEKICDMAGRKIEGCSAKTFPTAAELKRLSLEELKSCSLGYRAEYIYETARKFDSKEYSVEMLEKLNDDALLESLEELKGVGIKVASCAMLFGFHRTDAFPIDVWMNRVLAEHYPDGFEFEKYRPYNGVMQQYLFAYRRGEN
ncbi:DNA-3-methyladenine glycosylase family protein [Lachnospiraceae bacterium C1.1]|nr:DNA glycosylase [Lachnospiraceae bacterium C1.1]